MRILQWVKNNKVITLIIVFLLAFVVKGKFLALQDTVTLQSRSGSVNKLQAIQEDSIAVPPFQPPEFAPTAETIDRIVIKESSMSLVVSDVRTSTDDLVAYAVENDGYMVSTNLTNPEESPFAQIVLRIPSDRMQDALVFFRSQSLKVTNENILGRDVTDEFVDIDERLSTLQKAKARFEEIMTEATLVEDILRVQREIINLQSQIDSLKGRQDSLQQNAALAKITIFLSTDELALPYTPTRSFRPNLIFKQAVRSLMETLQTVGEIAIWAGVYIIALVPIGLIGIIIYRRTRKSPSS